jgi:hypothetical protein
MKPIIFGIRKVYWIKEVPVYSPQEPSNNWIESTALGRLAFCLRKSQAGDAPALSFPGQGLRPCSRLIQALVRHEARYELVR